MKRQDPDMIPVRMLCEFAYCPRLGHLEWVQNEFSDNEHTLEGTRRHSYVDEEKGRVPDPEEVFEKFLARSVSMSSASEGLITVVDILEGINGKACPVEIKKGSGPEEGAWFADGVQIGAQMLVIRDNGYDCDTGYVYYAGSNRKVEVPLADVEVDVKVSILQFREACGKDIPPSPLVDSPKCRGCSLAGICLPDETLLSQGLEIDVDRIRLLYPARDDKNPLVVMEQGAFVGKKGEELSIKKQKEEMGRVKLLDVASVNLYGNVQISTQVISELMDQGVPVCFYSFGGWFRGIAHGFMHKNVELRMRQYAVQADGLKCLDIATRIVEAKIRNCRTFLKRNGEGVTDVTLDEMKRLSIEAKECTKIESLLGIEGAGARSYFSNFSKMIRAEGLDTFDFEGRNRRPPKDPVNAMLSFCYSMLVRDLTVTAYSVGFDPMLGFYHTPRYGRPALALDMMEEFRPIVADSVVVGFINNGEVKPADFIRRGPSVAMKDDARKKLIQAYERRMNTLVTHPVFGYQVSYRRVLELQLRLLARHLLGEIGEYRPFMTR